MVPIYTQNLHNGNLYFSSLIRLVFDWFEMDAGRLFRTKYCSNNIIQKKLGLVTKLRLFNHYYLVLTKHNILILV